MACLYHSRRGKPLGNNNCCSATNKALLMASLFNAVSLLLNNACKLSVLVAGCPLHFAKAQN